MILVVDPDVTTLLDFHRRPHRRAGSGTAGQGKHRNGADGEDLVLAVPDGTLVRRSQPARDGREARTSRPADAEPLVDLVGAGTRYVLAAGGKGGLGNAALATSQRKAPGFALLGEPGDHLDVWLELKTVADVGLVGFPSAGKSSLVAALSAARPKIADYPFTTLVPNLGVVESGATRFTVADVPGLIPGASQGKGLGHDFLRHVERCSLLVHVLDCATLEPGRDPVSDLDAIERELADYGGLADRARMVVLNKVDVPEARELADFVRADLAARGLQVHEISAATHEGLRELAFAMAAAVRAARAAAPPPEPTRLVLRPKPVDGPEFVVTAEGGRYRVRGRKPERWVRQTDFSNDEAVGYLADRLARLGVEDELAAKGARRGDEVLIGPEDDAVVFDFDPSFASGAELLGPRGSDPRLEGR